MTWVKKVSSDWYPREHPGILVGDVVDFPGVVDKLLEEGSVVLCNKDGEELSTYESTGKVTGRELDEFKAWVEMKKQERLKETLSKQHDELLAQAAAIKEEKAAEAPVVAAPITETQEDAQKALEEKKKAWAKKMADARAAKKAEKEAQSA